MIEMTNASKRQAHAFMHEGDGLLKSETKGGKAHFRRTVSGPKGQRSVALKGNPRKVRY